MRFQVFAHANCFDGFGSMWAANEAFKKANASYGWSPEVVFKEVAYGEPVPEVKGDDIVLVLDFSYPLDVLKQMAEKAISVTVIDHHKTAQADLDSLPQATIADFALTRGVAPIPPRHKLSAYFDMERSGAGLSWDVLCAGHPRPKLIDYLEDRDLWSFKLPRSRAISVAIASRPKTFDSWTELAAELENHKTFAAMADIGDGILDYQEHTVKMMSEQSVSVVIAGHKARVVNATCFWSEIGNRLAAIAADVGDDFGISYFRRKGGEWQWGLRSIGDFDVSEVAKKFGGGGHKNASGFITKTLEEVLGG